MVSPTPFMESCDLTANLVNFLLLLSKAHADVINDWQYRKAKMAKNSEMYVMYWHAIFLGFCLFGGYALLPFQKCPLISLGKMPLFKIPSFKRAF